MLHSPNDADAGFLNLISWSRCKRGCSLLPKFVCLAIFLFATVAFALDPEKAITQFVHTAWTEKDGAPGDIEAIAQTTDGYLWLGTLTGLFRFDGVRFTRFEPPQGEHFPARAIRRLLATRDGSLWIRFDSGNVSRLLNGHVTSYSERNGLSETFSLAVCKDAGLIAGTARGLERFRDGTWEDVTRAWNFPGRQARLVYCDRAGTLLVVTEGRLLGLPAGQNEFVDRGRPTGVYVNLAEAPDGTIWASETSRSAHTVPSHDSGPTTEVRVGANWVLFDRNGGLWVSSVGDGLRYIADPAQIQGRQIAEFSPEAQEFTTKNGLTANYVHTLFEDREGNLWAGTMSGLDRFRKSVFTPIEIPHADTPRGILATRDGSLVTFPLNPSGVLRIDPRGNQKVLMHNNAMAMFEDQKGVLWLARQSGLYRWQRSRFVEVVDFHHPPRGGVVLQGVTGMTGDRDGSFWLQDQEKGLFHLDGGVIQEIASESEPTYPWGYLYTDRADRIWIGEYNHVGLYDHGKFQTFGTADGVPPGPVLAIYQDRAGNVWAGGSGGLSKFENGRFQMLSEPNGLPAQSVYGMAEDIEGCWWLATDSGVLRVPAGELDRAAADRNHRLRYEAFDELDGLPGKPRSSHPMPVVVRTTDGRIWIATPNGIAYVDPSRVLRNNLPPPVHVEAVKIGDRQLAPADGTVLPHSTNDIEIDYTALSLSIPERVLFRYKLEGADTDWHDAGTRRQAFYNHLAPRKYQFRVIACNNDGVWNEAGASWDFRIAPTFYQTAWFQVLCALAGAGLIWLLYQFRLRRMTARVDLRYGERLAERTRIARELHDTLLQSFHGLMFQFQAARNLLPRKPDSAIEVLDKAILATEHALAEGRDAISDLRPEAVTQQDLAQLLSAAGAEMADTLAANGFLPGFRVIVEGKPRTLSPALQREIYRIGREVIRNSFNHAAASRIEVEVHYDESQLRLRIRDDGKGIDPEALRASGRPGHWGLPGIRERAQHIGAELEFWSEAGAGTEMELRVPAAIAYEKQREGHRFAFFRRGGNIDRRS